ncbi:MAG: PorT family protein [Bacteroidales bacterium]|nr:PorT family protein [Bacteroidales bacterium]
MNKVVLCIVAILFLLKTHAQQVNFGIKIDPQLSWFSVIGEKCTGKETVMGINAGLVVDKRLSDNYFLSSGVSIATTGGILSCSDTFYLLSEYKDYPIVPGTKQLYRMQNIHIPLGLKFKTACNRKLCFYGETGIGFLVRLYSAVEQKPGNNDKLGVSEDISPVNFGYHLGGGIEVLLNDINYLQAGLNFSQGLLNVFSNDQITALQNSINLRLAIYF